MEEQNNTTPVETKEKQKKNVVTGKEGHARNRIIIGLVLVVVAIVMVFMSLSMFKEEIQQYQLYTVLCNCPNGEKITEDNVGTYFGVTYTTDKSMVANAWQGDIKALIGKYTARDLFVGRPLYANDLISFIIVENNDVVPEGKQLVSLAMPSINAGVGYLPAEGDIIRFYGMDENHNATVFEFLQYVEIYKIVDGAGNRTNYSGSESACMIFAFEPEQVKQLYEVTSGGGYYLSLVSCAEDRGHDAFLEEQLKICVESRSKVEAQEVELVREDVILPMSLFEYVLKGVPAKNATIEFHYTDDSMIKVVDTEWNVGEGDWTKIQYPTILKYVQLVELLYRGKPVDSSQTGYYSFENTDLWSMHISVTQEQLDAILSMKEKSDVTVGLVVANEEELAAGYAEVDVANREIIADKNNAKDNTED